MMIGIQFFAPIRRPTAEDIGWKTTKVTKNKETAKLRSLDLTPISVVKPEIMSVEAKSTRVTLQTLCLGIANIASVQAIEEVQQGHEWKQEDVEFDIECSTHCLLFRSYRKVTRWNIRIFIRIGGWKKMCWFLQLICMKNIALLSFGMTR